MWGKQIPKQQMGHSNFLDLVQMPHNQEQYLFTLLGLMEQIQHFILIKVAAARPISAYL
jgi:hypothetical protein